MWDPESIVKAFIADYYQWNTRAFEFAQGKETPPWVFAEYGQILSRYCRDNFSGLGIAYGSPSSHDPDTERVREITMIENQAIVKTTNKGRWGRGIDYEYLLVRAGHRWFLEAVDYVDEEGRYPTL